MKINGVGRSLGDNSASVYSHSRRKRVRAPDSSPDPFRFICDLNDSDYHIENRFAKILKWFMWEWQLWRSELRDHKSHRLLTYVLIEARSWTPKQICDLWFPSFATSKTPLS